MRLPRPRGPLSAVVLDRLATGRPLDASALALARRASADPDALADEDLQITLATCYELHYTGFEGVDDRWEWDPHLLALRAVLEDGFERAVVAAVPVPPAQATVGGSVGALADFPADLPVDQALRRLIDADTGPQLSSYLSRHGTAGEFREFVAHRSVYHLKEADPHTWGIPRVSGRTKAALVEIQSDEYGNGRPDRMHAAMFAATMRALDLDDTPGAYWDLAPASTLATTNLMSLFGLHRRWRGALLGHLAVLEMTSTTPNRRYGLGLRRLGFGPEACAFYDEHVEADAVHEQLAAVDLCGSFAATEPDRAADVLFGAAAAMTLDARFAEHLLDAWKRGRSSLLSAPGRAA